MGKKQNIKDLNCTWADVILFYLVSPRLILNELRKIGFASNPHLRFIEIPISDLNPAKSTIYTNEHTVFNSTNEQIKKDYFNLDQVYFQDLNFLKAS